MITNEEFVVIHTLKKQGHSIRSISKITKLDRRTISKRLKEDEKLLYKKREYKSHLDKYKDYIISRVNQALPNKIPSSVIYDEICEYGYEGKIRVLQYYLASLNPKHKKQEIIRFETEPGFQGQVDWTIIRSGKNPIYGFVMTLGYSRATFVYFTSDMKQDTWQDCHIKAFEYFGGIPQTLLYDNLKSVIIKRDKYGLKQHGFNERFLEFAKHRFVAKVCQPYRAQTKGKVERFNRYLKENFYIPLRAKLQGSGVNIDVKLLNTYLFAWLNKANERIHATTKQKPFELLQDELKHFNKNIPLIKPISKYNNVKHIENKVDIDVSYFTKLSDYDKVLLQGDKYAS